MFKFHKSNPTAEKPAVGDYLKINMVVKAEAVDSLIFSTKEFSELSGMPYYEPLNRAIYPGDYSDVLALMHVGDSASLKITADSFFKYMLNTDSLPSFIPKGSKIVFHIKLDSFVKHDDFPTVQEANKKARDEKALLAEQNTIAEYVAKNNITVKPLPSGLYYIENEKGKGPKPETGMIASVKYKGYFLDGTLFDESPGDSAMDVPINVARVIAGWDETLMLMNEGSKATIIVPSKLGYGATGAADVIPPFTPLLFEIEVVKIKKEEK